MKMRNNKAIALLTLMIMIMTLLVPASAFAAPPSMTFSSDTFEESNLNDGSISTKITAEIHNATFSNPLVRNNHWSFWVEGPANNEFYKAVPLTVNIRRINANKAEITITGKADNHASSQNSTLFLNFYGVAIKPFSIKFIDSPHTPEEPDDEDPEPEPGTGDEGGGGQAEVLDRGPIKVLEIYPNRISAETENINNKDVRSLLRNNSDYEITTISINRLISLKDEINGKYDVVYFNGGEYTRNYAYEHSYGSDITYLCAGKLEEFIQAGQLCIFHKGAFSNSGNQMYNTVLKEVFKSYADDASYRNVITVEDVNNGDADGIRYKNDVINNLDSLYQNITQGNNSRPVLEIIEGPATYSTANTEPISNRLTFSFKVYDPNTPINDNLKVALYIDRNNDSLYDEEEIVFYQGSEGERYTTEVLNGRSSTITYNMPQGLTGVYFWKLVVRDAQNAKNEYESVFRLKGNKITVRLLQIKPNFSTTVNSESDGNGNLSLSKKFGQSVDGHTYRSKDGEYEIIVTETTVEDFNKLAETGSVNLNGLYDMVVIGFNDNYTDAEEMTQVYERNDVTGRYELKYKGALGPAAVDALREFINTQQSVMFTHDTIHFQKNRDLTIEFADDVGQVFSARNGDEFAGIWTAGLAGSSLDGWVDPGDAKNQINIYDPVRDSREGNDSRHYQVVNTYPDLAKTVSPVNSSAVTLYPFILEGGEYDNPSSMKVASTHYQWYKLNLEDPDVIPLFNLYVNNKSKFNDDAMNNYYTYTKGNITYSGTGHKTDNNERYPEFETKLFVNTAIKAYSIANHAPEVTVLEPQDNEKVSMADGELTLRFRAYDFDFGNDYLKYEVFVDSDNGGEDDDFVSLTDGRKISMRNGEQITMTIAEDKMPDVGKFRLKVYAEDEFGAGSFKIITLERVDTPMITPSIEICDADGNPISGCLVNEEVKVKLGFAVSGKTLAETVCTPVFDLKGEYYTETERDYLTNESLGEVTFSNSTPDPQVIDMEHQFTINPASPGDTELTMTVTVRKIDDLIDAKSSADSVDIRSGQVEFYVKDKDGNPVRNAPIMDTDTGAILGMTDNAGYLHVDGLVGESGYMLGNLPGYTYNGNKKIYRIDDSGSLHDETEIDLTYDNNRWRVEFEVDYSLGLTIEYYKLNAGGASMNPIGGTGTVHEVKNHKYTPASIVAVVNVDPLASGELRGINFKIQTSDGVNLIEDTELKAVISEGPDAGIAALTGKAQLKTNNSVGEGHSFAGQSYFLLINVQETDDQIISIPEVTLTTVTPSGGTLIRTLTFSGGIKFIETTAPMLR